MNPKKFLLISAVSIALSFIFTSCGESAPSPSISTPSSAVSPPSSSSSTPSSSESESTSTTHTYYANGLGFLINNSGTLYGVWNQSGQPLNGKIVIPNEINGHIITSINNDGYIFRNETLITEIVFPDTLTNLPNALLYGCSGLKKVTLPKSLSYIPEDLFMNCSSLIDIEIPDAVATIEARAFSGCVSLKEIKLPANILAIKNQAFVNCEKLETVYLPKSLQIIGFSAFPYRFSLKEVYFAGNKKEWDSIEFALNSNDKANLEKILVLEE